MPEKDIIAEFNKEKGYLYCEDCSNETNGNWNIWVNPKHLCKHLRDKMSEEEIEQAVANFDQKHKQEKNQCTSSASPASQ